MIAENKAIGAAFALSGVSLDVQSGGAITASGRGNAIVTLSGDLTIDGAWTGDVLSLEADRWVQSGSWIGVVRSAHIGSLTVADTGSISADRRGYRGGSRARVTESTPGMGAANVGSGGGGHCVDGGAGQNGVGGLATDCGPAPYRAGGGGGPGSTGNGGSGGGVIKVVAASMIVVDGVISTTGGVGYPNTGYGHYGGGGGGGGSIWLVCETFLGTGTLQANGGAGGNGDNANDGGGGAGGQITVFYGIANGFSDLAGSIRRVTQVELQPAHRY